MNLPGKAAVITGASRGVGRATALALARAGCSVLINFNSSRDDAEQTAAAVRGLGVKAACFQGDIAQDAVCRSLMAAAVKEFGRLDVLINNAGTTRFIPFTDLEAVAEADWDRIFSVNLRGAFQCARAARPHLQAAGGGVIINVASVAGLTGAGSSIPYCASKAGVINLTLALARTLGPAIRVNAVAPGFIEGEWLRQGLGADYEAAKQAKAEQALLGRVSRPEDIAAAILSLIQADMVTGQTLVVDGGHSIGPRLAHGIK
ncbi:MAG TPA: glucose 1-dehydrogenase [Verrucomicrobiae bacterium]|nr:glucose 1-dehydrogenase [Verrucomicrobiae bacterium]